MSPIYQFFFPLSRRTAQRESMSRGRRGHIISPYSKKQPALIPTGKRWEILQEVLSRPVKSTARPDRSGRSRSLAVKNKRHEIDIPAVSVAAGIEAYYRSALNAMLNSRLTGIKADLFPNMHIQVPSRIAYICGFKVLRASLDQRIDPDGYEYPTLIRLATAVAPGIAMAPVSSLLEASNAGHMNSEPLHTRWTRGLVPRAGREIVFGVGLNQMSDYFEEQVRPYFPENEIMANATGSMLAGVVSGYCSHVPHNISTFKLMEPQKTYGELYQLFVDKSVPPAIDIIVMSWPSTPKGIARSIFATLFPRGLMIRTTQIIGSFVILNVTIKFVKDARFYNGAQT